MNAVSVPTVKLRSGQEIPQLGLGTARNDDATTRRNVADAIGLGYRLIDTAAKYENEVGVGQGIADAGIPRDELFVTTKLRGSEQGYGSTLQALDSSLERLGLDYVDLYLIHWPLPRLDRYVDSWRAMEEAVALGKVRAIGVSNFLPEHLDRLAAETTTVPVVNQIEIHPQFPNRELIAENTRRGIVTESWSPLANANDLLKSPVLDEIASTHGCSAVQVVLAWHLHQGLVVIPKASHPDRLRQNLDVFDIHLTDDDVARIATLSTGERSGGQDPATHEEF
ncbi:aldo/keto reductase [Kineosporia succinea]|uniref:Diketogulonate reductase-like aldo/keto reductase n=1 Tax=Kineosporia succinea TaxID=84632 RepID=A0ABT9P735_9ACTN|nr:aldo/keto reductase [Kineosporia succinea]MDP9828506.1 diketogulonate reductase-like aldo/keto reductase [Kineosporia succinea]